MNFFKRFLQGSDDENLETKILLRGVRLDVRNKMMAFTDYCSRYWTRACHVQKDVNLEMTYHRELFVLEMGDVDAIKISNAPIMVDAIREHADQLQHSVNAYAQSSDIEDLDSIEKTVDWFGEQKDLIVRTFNPYLTL